MARYVLQALGHVLAELVQCSTAAWAGRRGWIDNALARQMVWQWAPRRLAAGEAADLDLSSGSGHGRRFRRDLARGRGLFQIGELQLKLIDQPGRAFRGGAEPLMPQPGDGEGQAGDQPGSHIREAELTIDELAQITRIRQQPIEPAQTPNGSTGSTGPTGSTGTSGTTGATNP